MPVLPSPTTGLPQSFVPEVSDDEITDLRARLDATRWPEEATEPGNAQGPALADLRELVGHWQRGYDWDRLAKRLGSVPQIRVEVDGLGIHAVHVRSSRPDAVPLVLTHGWPSTCFEFLDLVPLLTEPRDGQAFHVVAPSLPGHGWSARPSSTGWGIERTADAWAALMEALGYPVFVAHGGDWGAVVSSALARRHPDRVAGLHLTLPVSRATEQDRADASDSERRGLEREDHYRKDGYAYAQVQRSRPQTIGYGLVDSPVALCAWIAEKLWDWSGTDQDGISLLSFDDVLDIVSVYWLTATGASAARLYREVDWRAQAAPVDVPTGCSIFPAEIIRPPRSAVARQYRDLRHWREMDRGGHFAAAEVPDLLAAEIQAFVATLGGLETSPFSGQTNSCEGGRP
ncbi:epoxide hydrolase family protein [Nocardioides sp. Root190]|uniref:epoxide hydrolase family protein n=1 Tax=Nocardioides sp. Root190 TaxID=1736488 RepID=UPI0009EAF580|nr:epoxide hydrolase family protein [Nocardioides sp. Root190]